jgi:outer membrane protein assembly factor BamB
MTSRVAFAALSLLASLSVGGCDLVDRYFGAPPKTPLAGERQSVLRGDSKITPDARVAQIPVEIPEPTVNESWPQPGGVASHVTQHLAVAGIGVAWRASLGSGASRDGRVTGTPVVADGRVYAMDAGTRLSAFDAQSGARIWSVDVEAAGSRSSGGGGGVAVAGPILVVATGQAQVLGIEAATGTEIWRITVTAPLRSGPAIAGNRAFAISVDNQVHAIDTQTGAKLWSQAAITESAGLFGSSTPAVDGNIVIATFSSGEIYAMRVDNGRVVWSEGLGGSLRADAISSLADVRGLPIVDRGVVYAVSHSGRMAAIDLRSGARIWDQNIGSFNTPWLAGEFLFVTTLDAEVVAVHRRDGRVRWVSQLEQFSDPQRKRGRIVWTGPTLVGNRLVVLNSEGQAVTLSPKSGEVMERLRLPGSATLPPAVANRTLYVVTDGGDLVALR